MAKRRRRKKKKATLKVAWELAEGDPRDREARIEKAFDMLLREALLAEIERPRRRGSSRGPKQTNR